MAPAKKTPNVTEGNTDVTKSNDKKEEATVVVSKSDLEAFLKRLEGLEADNKRLIAVADKGRLAREEEKRLAADGTPLIRTVKLTRVEADGPIVVAWKLTENESFVDGNRMVERQNIRVFFENGEHKDMRLIDFYRAQKRYRGIVAEIISRSRDERSGETMLKVELRDGKQLDIPLKFVN